MTNLIVKKMIQATVRKPNGCFYRDVYINPIHILRVYEDDEGSTIDFIDGSHEQVRESASTIAGAFESAMNGLKEDGK